MLVLGRYVVGEATVDAVILPPLISGAVGAGMPVRSVAMGTPVLVTNW